MTALVLRRALADYLRRPLNLVLLVAVPAVMVVALEGQLASFSKLLSTIAKPAHLEVATAGWAAAGVAGLTAFFQVVGSRTTDRRLAAASARGPAPIVAGRLAAVGGLALAAAAAALAALALRGGVADPARAIPAIVVISIIYVAIGVLVGSVVRSEMNGALVVTVIWLLDMFVGSGLGGSSSIITRVFPLHFPTMILTAQAQHHGGPLGDAAWTAIWAAGLATLAVTRLAVTTGAAPRARVPAEARAASPVVPERSLGPFGLGAPKPRADAEAAAPPRPGLERAPRSRLAAGLWAAARAYRRDRVLWALLVVVPVSFIGLAAAQTPPRLMPVALVDGARRFMSTVSLRQLHAGEMASIASALLAGVAGLFVVTGSADGDRRLVLAGFRPRQVLASHLGVIAGAALVTTTVSLAVSAAFFSPDNWVEYAGADLLIALTYATIGVLLGPLTGRLGGLYLLLLASIVDVGYGQTVMFQPVPPTWGAFLPARAAGKLMLDGGFTSGFEQYGYLLLALGWLAALTTAAVAVFRHRTGVKRRVTAAIPGSTSGSGTARPVPAPPLKLPGRSPQSHSDFMPPTQDGPTIEAGSRPRR